MSQRERMMLIGIGALAVVWLLFTGWTRYQGAVDYRWGQVTQVEDQLSEAELSVRAAQKAMRSFDEWRTRSLPNDPDLASTVYGVWLHTQLSDAGMNVNSMAVSNNPSSGRGVYETVGYLVQASGDLEEVTEFLVNFYEGAPLHKMSRLLITPGGGNDRSSSQLSVSFNAEAVLLPGARAVAEMPEFEPNRLDLADEDEYVEIITSRNVFQPYERPRRQVVENPGRELMLTAVYGEGPTARVGIKRDGDVSYFSVGSAVRMGSYRGRIEEIAGREIVVSTEDERRRIRVGETLDRGSRLPRAEGEEGAEEANEDEEQFSRGRRGRGGRGSGRGGRGGRGRFGGDEAEGGERADEERSRDRDEE